MRFKGTLKEFVEKFKKELFGKGKDKLEFMFIEFEDSQLNQEPFLYQWSSFIEAPDGCVKDGVYYIAIYNERTREENGDLESIIIQIQENANVKLSMCEDYFRYHNISHYK